MVSSEFGRTPKINGTAGRDHWPRVFSIVLAGGGIKTGLGLRHVRRDRRRAGFRPAHGRGFRATVYHQLGIDADKDSDRSGQPPIEIVKDGEVVKELLA